MICYSCGNEIKIDFTKIPKEVKTFDAKCKKCGAFIKIDNSLQETNIPIIKYFSSSSNGREIITIFKDRICYQKNNSNISKKEPTEIYKINIVDSFFVDSMILGNAYMPLKSKMIEAYNNVKNMSSKQINRSKNSSQKSLQINDKDFVANIDMYITEYGDIYNKFIQLVKKMLINQIENKEFK